MARILEAARDSDVQWLLTEALPGLTATDPSCSVTPEATVRALARGLRRFHEAPTRECPFDFRLDSALALARRRLDAGVIDPREHFHDEFAHLTPTEAVEWLEGHRPEGVESRLVVCHGDYCFPNVLIEEGEAVGFVDLGELGVADPWWDLSVATWSVAWNVGSEFEAAFLDEYGQAPDPELSRYYRLLYDVVS